MASNGVAAEFFAAAELTKQGAIATITNKNTKDIDIIAANPHTGETVLIQVKEKLPEDHHIRIPADENT